jgi:hypothetical protein
MRTTAKQTPLGVNLQSGYLQNSGFSINQNAESYMGVSKVNGQYTFGTLVKDTCLNLLTWAIHDAYNRGVITTSPAGTSTYDNLINIGSGVCEVLGNSKPPTYNDQDPSTLLVPTDVPTWYTENCPATTGYAISGTGYASPGVVDTTNINGQGQEANWTTYDMTNPNNSITQWGFIRCWALQAWNEFNWNGGTSATGTPLSTVQYKDFCLSWTSAVGFIDYNNVTTDLLANAPSYLEGVYSNMNDLNSADITGISLATTVFGRDCIAAGKVIDLSKIDKFGLPSVLLQTIYKFHAMTQSLNLALISADLTPDEIINIANTSITPSKTQELKIYGSFLVIVDQDLIDILVPLNCKTPGLTSLADLLDVKKLFPFSYTTLTLPVYNTEPGPTNSKTYYPIYKNGTLNDSITNPNIASKIGYQVPAGDPPIIRQGI